MGFVIVQSVVIIIVCAIVEACSYGFCWSVWRAVQKVERGGSREGPSHRGQLLGLPFSVLRTCTDKLLNSRTWSVQLKSWNVALQRRSYILNANRRLRNCTNRSTPMLTLSLRKWKRRLYASLNVTQYDPFNNCVQRVLMALFRFWSMAILCR